MGYTILNGNIGTIYFLAVIIETYKPIAFYWNLVVAKEVVKLFTSYLDAFIK